MYYSSRSSSSRRGASYNKVSNYRSGRGGGATDVRSQYGIRRMIHDSKNHAPSTVVAEVYAPKNKFADFNIDERLKQNISRRNYTIPTAIQDQVIPHVLQGKDLVGIADTGSGKSAAFLIPLLHKVLSDNREQILVIVPTRELATQLDEEMRSLAPGLRVFSAICVGGLSMYNQISALRRQPNFVFGTPGRLKDLLQRGHLRLGDYSTIVLDEVDRMLDMGFIRDIKFLLDQMPSQRQSLFFSATITGEVEGVMKQFVQEFVKISVKTGETKVNIDQQIVEVKSRDDKLVKLKLILGQADLNKAIVFVGTKREVDRIETALYREGFNVAAIHGDKRQGYRQSLIRAFKEGKVKALIATDVAARGLDIANLSHVINYDLPKTTDDYVHRIGRVGRGDNKGIALTFMPEVARPY